MKNTTTKITLFAARERAMPFQHNLNSVDIVTLAMESIQLAKLVATEQRDLEAIRTDYILKEQFLRNMHEEAITYMEKTYKERSQMIDVINQNAQLLIKFGEYAAAKEVITRLTEFISSNSPLRAISDLRHGG
jgi:hypothetical protein